MSQKDLDAIFVTEYNNYPYLSGHRSTMKELCRDEPFVYVLPEEDSPVLIGPKYMEKPMRRDSCVKNIRTYEMPYSVNQVINILDEIGLNRGKIGVELGLEFYMEISHGDFAALVKEMKKVEFVDAADVLWELRRIKSDAEIECLRKSCAATSKAFDRLFDIAKKGMTEEEIVHTMYNFMLDEGAEKPGYVFAHIWPGGVYLSQPTRRSLKDGDTLWIDAGAIYKGYRSDFNRMAVVGTPKQRQREAYEYVRDITLKCIDAVRPQAKLSELYQVYISLERKDMVSGHPGNIGHNIGLSVTEPPYITANENCLLEKGMVHSIEPGALTEQGYFGMEELMVVTEDSYEILTTASRELHVI